MTSLVKILEKLINFKTISFNHEENERALRWIEDQLKGLPIFIKRFNFNGFPSLVITTRKTPQLPIRALRAGGSARGGRAGQAKNTTVWLAAHVDVVGAPDELFVANIKNGRLYGRGAHDMKFAVACYIKLLKDLGKELCNYNLSVMLTTDEEIGGRNGTKKILERGYEGGVCILPDSGYSWKFSQSSKGILRLEVVVSGVPNHSSRPWLAKNPIYELMEFLEVLRREFPVNPDKNAEHYYTTLVVTKIEAGDAPNQIPAQAHAILDIRYIADTNKDKVLHRILEHSKNFSGVDIEEIRYTEPAVHDIENKYFKIFSNIAHDLFKIKIGFTHAHGASDAGFFLEKNIPTLIIAPTGGDHHGKDEWIDIEDLEKFYEVLKEFVKQVGGEP